MAERITKEAQALLKEAEKVEGLGNEIALTRLMIRETFVHNRFYAALRAIGTLARLVQAEAVLSQRGTARTRSSKARGPDGWSPEFLRKLEELGREELELEKLVSQADSWAQPTLPAI